MVLTPVLSGSVVTSSLLVSSVLFWPMLHAPDGCPYFLHVRSVRAVHWRMSFGLATEAVGLFGTIPGLMSLLLAEGTQDLALVPGEQEPSRSLGGAGIHQPEWYKWWGGIKRWKWRISTMEENGARREGKVIPPISVARQNLKKAIRGSPNHPDEKAKTNK